MLDILKKIFPASSSKEAIVNDDTQQDAIQLAFAALLVEAASADENFDDKEKTITTRIIKNQFSLDTNTAQTILDRAIAKQKDAVDLHQFTKEVKTLPEEEKIQFVEGLWEVILSDGVRDPFEDAMVRRVCALMPAVKHANAPK